MSEQPTCLIEADQLCKIFNEHTRNPVYAVKNVSFRVAKGEIYGLLGPNGAGKTTALRMLATIITPTSGSCRVAGYDAATDPQEVRRRIGFLSGNTKLYQRLTAHELLVYFGRLYDMAPELIEKRIDELAQVLNMDEFMDQRCGTLSTGQAQKTSIARVILHDPPLLILDEPTLGLDIMTSRNIIQFIKDARNRGHSIIFSTHYMSEAEQLCDRIGFIHQGQLMVEGTQQELFAQSGTDNLSDAFFAMADKAEGRDSSQDVLSLGGLS